MSAGPSTAPTITGLRQVCLVVEDFDAAVTTLAAQQGIGPWKCWTLGSPRLFDTELAGAPAPWSVKLGVAWVGASQLEVIQPQEGDTVHRRFLDATPQGGIQHALVETSAPYGHALAGFAAAGFPAVQSAKLNLDGQVGSMTIPKLPGFLRRRFATRLAYLDTVGALGTTLELSKLPPGISFERGIALAKADRTVAPDDTKRAFDMIDGIGFLSADVNATRDAFTRAGLSSRREVGDVTRWNLARTSVEVVHAEAGPLADELSVRGGGLHHLRCAVASMPLEHAVATTCAARGAAELFRIEHPMDGETVFLSAPAFGATRLALHRSGRSAR